MDYSAMLVVVLAEARKGLDEGGIPIWSGDLRRERRPDRGGPQPSRVERRPSLHEKLTPSETPDAGAAIGTSSW